MNGDTASLLAKLDDIRGLDAISVWPLAPAWWVLLALALGGSAYLCLQRRLYARSWKGDAAQALRALESGLGDRNGHDVAAALSDILRRVAIRRFSRAECAGLEGLRWLGWLKEKDPKGFDWPERGKMLVEAPYAPPGRAWPAEDVRPLIDAAKEWVK